MLYINENEKTYIRSLYYTSNLNEQGSADSPRSFITQNQYAGYTNHQNKLTDKTINNLLTKYDITTSEGRHNLLDDGELLATFVSAGGGILVGIFHGFYYFWEGVYTYADNKIGKIKSFFLGLFQLITALPGIVQLKFSGIDKWIDVIKNSKSLIWLEKIGDWFQSGYYKFDQLFKSGFDQLNRLKGFIQQSPNLKFLSSLLELIIKSAQLIAQWFKSTVSEILVTIRQLVGKQGFRVVQAKVDQMQDNNKVQNFERTIDSVGNIIDKGNQYANPTQYATQNTKNTQTATQDTINPNLNYKSMPTTLKNK